MALGPVLLDQRQIWLQFLAKDKLLLPAQSVAHPHRDRGGVRQHADRLPRRQQRDPVLSARTAVLALRPLGLRFTPHRSQRHPKDTQEVLIMFEKKTLCHFDNELNISIFSHVFNNFMFPKDLNVICPLFILNIHNNSNSSVVTYSIVLDSNLAFHL